MAKRTLIVIRKPPFGSLDSWEAFRCSLSFYTTNMPVEILLEGLGVFNWMNGIIPVSTDPHSISRFVGDLQNFVIPVFIVEEDLREQGLTGGDMVSSYPKIISRVEAARMIASHETTIAM